MNIANKLTLIRVILIPIFMFFLLSDIEYGNYIALIIFIIASFTDFLDGYFARKFNLITNFGKFVDPLADKLLVTSAFLCFIKLDKISVWVVFIILSREFIVSIFRAVAASQGVVIAASYFGKFKTVSQMIAIILILMNNYPFSIISVPLDNIMIWICTILTVISGVDYIYKNKNILSEK